jgi:hypothetical protein
MPCRKLNLSESFGLTVPESILLVSTSGLKISSYHLIYGGKCEKTGSILCGIRNAAQPPFRE